MYGSTWNTWGQWNNPCPSCGLSILRTFSRSRTCNQVAGQAFCTGSSTSTEVRTCSIPNCIGTWAAWTSWTTPNCPTCGPVGTQRQVTRNRVCNKQLSTDLDCPGSNTDSRLDTCSIPVCTATWNTWGQWNNPCPSCGLSILRTFSRSRTCNQVAGQAFCTGSSTSTEVRTCSIPNCIGTWTQWNSWAATGCPSCNPTGTTSTGTFTRSRTCNKALTTDLDCPGAATDSKTDTCNIATCRVGSWTVWSSWSAGSCPTCGNNVNTEQNRTRTCFRANVADTECPGSTSETQTVLCQIPQCEATWNTWSPWVDPGCPSCGLGVTRTASRTRTCNQLAGLSFCSGSSFSTEVRSCNIPNCIGTWTAWTSWNGPACPTCGPSGTTRSVSRSRTCNKVRSTDANCPGLSTSSRTDQCSIPLCTATWNTWGAWVDPGCPSCGQNIVRTAIRTRTCNQVAGQASCIGSSFSSEVRTCTISNCQGTWAAWTSWTTPSCPTCGPVGTQRQVTRNRVCNKQLSTDLDCVGSTTDSRFDTCSIPVCTATWNTWNQWNNPCPSCGLSISRTFIRTRTCNQVAGQAFCTGSSTSTEVRTCSIPNCIGTWTQWNSWAATGCPSCNPTGTTSTGTFTRSRTCNKALTTDLDCPGAATDTKTDTCNIATCRVGTWTTWTTWATGNCPTCGVNINTQQTRTRTCSKTDPTVDDCNGTTVDTRTVLCQIQPCQASWNQWSQWSTPSCPSCGLNINRTVSRTRTCNQLAGQTFCTGSSFMTAVRTCNIPNCIGTWAAWTSWTTPNCPTCGSVGTQRQVTRNRVCNKQLSTDVNCPGSTTDSRFDTCSIPVCTATWNTWNSWSDPGCPSCGVGVTRTASRTRTCNQVFGQTFCPGSSFEQQIRTCNVANCIGTWSAWTAWKLPNCPSCGPVNTVRQVSRTRVCNKASPTHSNCAGNNIEYRNDACNIPTCTDIPGLCANVMNVSGVGYRYHPKDCDKYVQCYFNPNGEVTAVYRTCPFGHYWSQATMRCDHSWKVTCPHERCNDTCVTTYNMEGSCRAYWSCDKGKSQAECCAVGFRYVPGKGCFPDLYCRDPCPTPCTPAETCDKAPVWDNSQNYKMSVGFLGWMDTSCIPGAYFDILECGCNVRKNDTCKPEFSLTFNNQNATQGDMLTLDTVNVTNGVAAFTGLGKMVADVKLAEAGVSCPVVLRFRYRENGSRGRQVLASSSDCRHGNTMIIAIHNSTLTFELTSWYGTLLSMPLSTMGLEASTWKDVTLMYNGKVLTGVIRQGNYRVMSQLFAPKVNVAACGLTFGSDGSVLTAYDGQMDEINVYKCDPGNLY
ncbi:SCO-spondin-like [Haliotis rubra]|uniref:SCO-spondin-like n=1 Tax=Haliotis rubra TaxID=36100 RepID=UPI001EE5E55A|nr:SCO-spondin-like [Haliotis rubra]